MPEIKLTLGNCLDVLATYPDNYFDSIVTDPPAGIKFMGKEWDKIPDHGLSKAELAERYGPFAKIKGLGFIIFIQEVFKRAMPKLKPGGHILVWALPRTSHWTVMGLELAGYEIRDIITHLFGSGFPKNYDLAKGLELFLTTGNANWNNFRNVNGKPNAAIGQLGYKDNAIRSIAKIEAARLGFTKIAAEQGARPENYEPGGYVELDPTTQAAFDWLGWGTALSPANEHWILGRKPRSEKNNAANVLKWGVGGINIGANQVPVNQDSKKGRWPSNLLLSHTLFCVQVGTKIIPGRESAADLTPSKPGPTHIVTNVKTGAHHGDQEIIIYDCADGCPVKELDEQAGILKSGDLKKHHKRGGKSRIGTFNIRDRSGEDSPSYGDEGRASRFFPNLGYDDTERALFAYFAKPSRKEKNAGCDELPAEQRAYNGQSSKSSADMKDLERRFTTAPAANSHPTVKSVELMLWLMRLITPPGGRCLDMFAGSGPGAVAAYQGGFDWQGIELNPVYLAIAEARLEFAMLQPEVQAAVKGQMFFDWQE